MDTARTPTYPGLLEFIAAKAETTADALDLDRTLEFLDLDSLTLIEIALFIQRRFGIEVPEGALRLDQKLSEWFAYLDGRRDA
jgi:acyl carrier protein